jgi:glutaredoxin-dependent peroxiredoxin
MHPQVGQQAPAFSLFDTGKKEKALSDYRSKNLLILFFPLAFTSVCTRELCSIRDNIAFYNNSGAETIGISVDSLYTLAKFKEEQQLNFTLLSDFNKEVSEAYGCLYQTFSYKMKGVSKRAAFVIDGSGVIQYAEVLEDAGKVPDFAMIQGVLSALQAGVKV